MNMNVGYDSLNLIRQQLTHDLQRIDTIETIDREYPGLDSTPFFMALRIIQVFGDKQLSTEQEHRCAWRLAYDGVANKE